MIDRSKYKGVSIYIVLQEMFKMELDEISIFLNETSLDLKRKQDKLKSALENASDDYNPLDYYEDEIYRYFQQFPVFTFNPMLLNLYGFFESCLKKLCEFHENINKSKLRVNELGGNNYIQKSKIYLEVIAEVDFSKIEKEHTKIRQIQKIRNYIAHNNSNIIKDANKPLEKQELYIVLKKDKRIKLDLIHGDFYVQDKDFLLEVVELIKTHLIYITNELYNHQKKKV